MQIKKDYSTLLRVISSYNRDCSVEWVIQSPPERTLTLQDSESCHLGLSIIYLNGLNHLSIQFPFSERIVIWAYKSLQSHINLIPLSSIYIAAIGFSQLTGIKGNSYFPSRFSIAFFHSGVVALVEQIVIKYHSSINLWIKSFIQGPGSSYIVQSFHPSRYQWITQSKSKQIVLAIL